MAKSGTIKSAGISKTLNKTDVPDNVILKRHKQVLQAQELEEQLPTFLTDFCLYLKNAVAPSTRVAYLNSIVFFLTYLIHHHPLFIKYATIRDIDLDVFATLKARDINFYIGDYCAMYEKDSALVTNNNRSLSKKRSTLSVLFKFLYRDEKIPVNIVDGFNPIKAPKTQPDAIKRLEVEEIPKLLDLVSTGVGLSEKERVFWNKTKLRDKAIMVLFLTYGLRVSELQQLDIGSFQFERNDFTIYRKRGKESRMPMNASVVSAVRDYIENERGVSLDKDEPLFLSLQKKRITIRALRDLVKKYTSHIIGGTGYSPHKLRATAASTMIEFGFSIYDVQNILDHENVTTTQLYSAHRRRAKDDVVRNFELDKVTEDITKDVQSSSEDFHLKGSILDEDISDEE